LYDRAAELAAKGYIPVEEFVPAVLANRLARAKLFNREEFERALEAIPVSDPAGPG